MLNECLLSIAAAADEYAMELIMANRAVVMQRRLFELADYLRRLVGGTTILVKDGGTLKTAEFEPVRTVRGFTLGWCYLSDPSHDDMRFPVIVALSGHVTTVRDWQANYRDVDLMSPESVRDMMRTRGGSFVSRSRGEVSILGNRFK